MASVVVEIVAGEVAAQGAAKYCCQNKVDRSNWKLSRVVDEQRPVKPAVQGTYALMRSSSPKVIFLIWLLSFLGLAAGILVPAAIDDKWGNNLNGLYAIAGLSGILMWANAKITAFERTAEHFVVTYGISGKVVRIPISTVTAVGFQSAGGCCPCLCFDLSAETDCSENKRSVAIATTHEVGNVSKATTVILDLVDPDTFLSENFGALQAAGDAVEMQPVSAEPQAVNNEGGGGNGSSAVVVPAVAE